VASSVARALPNDAFGNLTDKKLTAGSAPVLDAVVNPANNRISTVSLGDICF